jgi:L-glyceraldehyde reductase
VIPKSVTPSRIVENFKEVELSPEDIAEIEAVGKEQRRYNIPFTASKLFPGSMKAVELDF